MPRLILLNGPPAAGKSTLARRWVADHPLALALDVDVLREMLGGWRGDPHAAGLAARELAVAAAGAHLAAGHDVVVPQLLARPEFADRLAALAGAGYVEVAVLLARDECVRRYVERWRAGADPVHGRAAAPEVEPVALLHDRVAAFVAGRPHVRVIDGAGGPDAVHARLAAVLAG